MPHLLLPDNHSQSRVGTGPGPAGRRDRHPSPGSVARSPSSSRRCGSQALQIVQPLWFYSEGLRRKQMLGRARSGFEAVF